MDEESGRFERTLVCEAGIQRLFGLGDIGRSGLVSGWSAPEDSHIWNDGFDAVLAVSVPNAGRAMRILAVGEPFVTHLVPVQDLTLYANGFRLGFWRMIARQVSTIDAVIQPFQMHSERETAQLVFTFHLPLSVRPAEFADSADERLLGFCFRTLTLDFA